MKAMGLVRSFAPAIVAGILVTITASALAPSDARAEGGACAG